ncbi:uncharacterized protein LOC141618476 [Silene latifolia]|uniref:uncharacterized protein LOC141618476 n=1 Tax=Silene latifolia TaxID=37657 RepID=UPI003D771018
MPKSSRHKSSKHSTRDAKGYSVSEKEPGLKENKVREGVGSTRHLKDITAGEKRKLDSKSGGLSKEIVDLGNAEFEDAFGGGLSSSSKKRKEKVVDDRWVVEDDTSAHEMSKSVMKEKEVLKGSGDGKRSSRRDDSRVSGFDVEEMKKSGSKAESKHHRSERKERGEKERGSERERKGSRSDKSDKLVVDIVSVSENTSSEGNKKQSGSGKERGRKHVVGNTDFDVQVEFKHPEPERDLGKRVGRKRDGSGDADRHHDAVPDPDDRRRSSREERNGKHNDDGPEDERNGDRFLEDIDKDIRRQDEKKRDSRSTRYYTDNKSDDKHLKNDKDLHLSHKISKHRDGEYDRELGGDRERYRDHDYDRERGRDRDRERNHLEFDRDRGRDRERADCEHDHVHDIEQEDHERVHDRDHELDRNREYGRERYRREPRDRARVRDHERGRERNFDHENDYASHVDERSSRYKDDRGRRRSPDNYDGYHGDKLRGLDTEVDKERSLSLKPNVVSSGSSNRHRDSPSSKAYVGAHKYREGIEDETQYGDTLRDGIISESVEKVPKYQSGEKRAKFDDNRTGEIYEASPNTKVLSAGMKDRSPSSTSFDRNRFSRRNTRRSFEADDGERRCSDSIDIRDTGITEDRQGRDLPSKNSLGEDHPPAESPFYHKTGQGNVSSHSPGPSVFRTRPDSPSFGGPYGDNKRGPGNRYRRSVDPNVGRGPGNAWNGLPNWASPLPNGFIPFPPGPPGPHHGGFPPIIPQFPPFYGARPTLDINHQGIPYHLADGDRLAGHGRPIGWPNMAEGLMPPFHGWNAGSIHRTDPAMYGPGPGQFAQRMDIMDNWKQNGDLNTEVVSGSLKDVPASKASADEASSAHGASKHNVESCCPDDQATSFKDASSDLSPMKEIPLTPAKGTTDKTPESSGADDYARSVCAYFLKFDISMDLVDPELYNQCSLATKGRCEYVEDEADLGILEEKTDLESEIRSSTVDVKFLPAAKESIFQRAMSSYKTQISERNISLVSDGDKFYNPAPSQPKEEHTLMEKVDEIYNSSPSQPEVEQTPMEKVDMIYNPSPFLPEVEQTLLEKVDTADCSVKQEEPAPVHLEEIIPEREDEIIDLALKPCNETQMPVFDAEKIVGESSLELLTGNADKGDVFVESTYPGTILSNPDMDIVVDDGKTVGDEPVSEMQLDDTVSGSLILCNDSVKDCEGLFPVSNESESAVLSRIHHAPESTH